jgi:hypothetical protein
VYLRYFHLMNLEQHKRLTRICFIEYDREMALVAERRDPRTGECEILGVGRLMKIHGTTEAEVANYRRSSAFLHCLNGRANQKPCSRRSLRTADSTAALPAFFLPS